MTADCLWSSPCTDKYSSPSMEAIVKKSKGEMQSCCAELSHRLVILERNRGSAGRERCRATKTRKMVAQWRIGGELRRRFKVVFALSSESACTSAQENFPRIKERSLQGKRGPWSDQPYSQGNHRPVATALSKIVRSEFFVLDLRSQNSSKWFLLLKVDIN